MSNFEKKFGKYAVSNLSLKLVILYVIGYVLYYVKPDIFSLLVLDVTALMNGQIWRLFSWLLVPPESGSNFLFVAIMLYFYYSIGTSLERVWGDYKYNVYIIELDMDIYHYKHLETGSKISFLTDADTSIDCTVLYVRGQYVLCIPAAEEDDYQKMLKDSPTYNNVEFERACLNFQHGS